MIRTLCLVIATFTLVGCQSKSTVAKYGEPMKLSDSSAVPVATVLSHPEQYDGKYVRVTGNVGKVCEKHGCWLEMTGDAGQTLFVKFTCPVEGTLVPVSAQGKPVVAEGTFKVTEVSEAEARHIAEDKGAKPEEIVKIVGSQKRIVLQSPGAQVTGM